MLAINVKYTDFVFQDRKRLKNCEKTDKYKISKEIRISYLMMMRPDTVETLKILIVSNKLS